MKSSQKHIVIDLAKVEAFRRMQIQRKAEIERTWECFNNSVTAELRQAIIEYIREENDHLVIRYAGHRPIKVFRIQTPQRQFVKFHIESCGLVGHSTSSLGEALAIADKSREMEGVARWGMIRRLRWALGLAFGGRI